VNMDIAQLSSAPARAGCQPVTVAAAASASVKPQADRDREVPLAGKGWGVPYRQSVEIGRMTQLHR
jgi:hypothetical protein